MKLEYNMKLETLKKSSLREQLNIPLLFHLFTLHVFILNSFYAENYSEGLRVIEKQTWADTMKKPFPSTETSVLPQNSLILYWSYEVKNATF